MRNSNLIHSDLSTSGPFILSIFFTLKTKEMGENSFFAQKEAKQRRIWKTYSWPSSGLKFFNRVLSQSSELREQSQFMIVIYF
jgi:hypothetical protein